MKKAIAILLIVSFVTSCVRNNSDTPQPSVTKGNLVLQVGYRFDNTDLLFDTISFINAASYKMSLTRLQYFLSGFRFIREDGAIISNDGVYYFDARNQSLNQINFVNIPAGNYTGLSFNIGLDSTINKTDYLPATTENNNMVWPIQMGGGYHFMKMEGNFIDTGSVFGYAMHLGKNPNFVGVSLSNKPFVIGVNLATLNLKMNVAEWYKNPTIYDFDKDGNFSMGNDAAMAKLKNNGTDVFN